MVVLIVIAAVVVVGAVVFLALGRGGGLSVERNDYFPLDLGPVSATDVALLRPPAGLWGYSRQATDEALELIAESIRERDVRIVALEQLVTDLSREQAPLPVLGSPYPGARHRRGPAGEVSAGPGETAEEATAGSPPAPSETGTAQPPPLSAETIRAGETAPSPETTPPAEITQAADSAHAPRFSFQPSRPAGDTPGHAPEESHD